MSRKSRLNLYPGGKMGIELPLESWHNKQDISAEARDGYGNETHMCGRDGPCGRGQDHPERGPALHRGTAAPPGPGGPRGRLSGHRPAGAGAGHHHLLQAGPAAPGGGERTDPDGHPRPRGLLRRDGAHPSGAGLRRAGHQRHRRGPGATPAPCGGCWSAITCPCSCL